MLSHLPQAAGPVAPGPRRLLRAPVDELDDQLGVEDHVGEEEGGGKRVDHVDRPPTPETVNLVVEFASRLNLDRFCNFC